VGILVWTLSLGVEDLRLMTRNLVSVNKPVALLDEIGNVSLPRETTSNPLFRTFVTAYTPMCSLDMGTYLVNRGHTAVSFFNLFPDLHVNRNRADGIEKRLRDASPSALLRRVALDEDMSAAQLKKIAGKNPEYPVAPGPGTNKSSSHFLKRYSAVRKQLALINAIPRHCAARIRAELARSETTAWVAFNDTLAFALLDILQAEGVAVPERISVVAFDDVPDAYDIGLTTYNFNISAIVNAMFDHILGGPLGRRLGNRRVVEIPGYVVERQTSGQAPVSSPRLTHAVTHG
jgi:hypothetical protein